MGADGKIDRAGKSGGRITSRVSDLMRDSASSGILPTKGSDGEHPDDHPDQAEEDILELDALSVERDEDGEAVEDIAADELSTSEYDEVASLEEQDWPDETEPAPSGAWILPTIAVLLTLGWIGAYGYFAVRPDAASLTPQEIIDHIVAVSLPLALIGVAALLLQGRLGNRQRRFMNVADRFRHENNRIGQELTEQRELIATVRSELDANRDAYSEASANVRSDVERMKWDSSTLLDQLGAKLAEIEAITARIESGAGSLGEVVPELDRQLTEIDHRIVSNGDALDRQSSTITEQGDALAGMTSSTDERLAALESRVETLVASLGENLDGYADRFERRIGDAGDKSVEFARLSSDSADEASERLIAHLAEAEVRVEALVARSGELAETVRGQFSETIGQSEREAVALFETITERLPALTERIEEENAAWSATSEQTINRMVREVEALNTSIETLIEKGRAETEALNESISAQAGQLSDELEGSRQRLLEGAGESREQLAEQLDQLSLAIGAVSSARQSEAQHFERLLAELDEKFVANREKLDELESQGIEKAVQIGFAAQTARDNLTALRDAVESNENRLSSALETIGSLGGGLKAIETDLLSDRLSQLDEVVERHANTLDAHQSTFSESVERQIALADKAADRIEARLASLNASLDQLDRNIAEGEDQLPGIDEEGFSRRLAMLTEALNSASIDIAKILSNEVADSAWTAYLKGDRGVFTRRAVRLLDNQEVRVVAEYYAEDGEFRSQVNRYIHDFEAMLRNILSTRDGHMISVVLLSSDIGKLYVALAQAIERLRT